ncbi:lipopolysaccharide transport system permease protein [Methanolinea mesophila]|nr:lipopolysaccharide transport system permease protein [Methanolinea mesophila]
MLILYVVFSSIFRVTEENFAIYLLVGIITWRFFANATSAAVPSIVYKASLVTKVFIPRQILVMSSVLSSLISSLLEFGVLFFFVALFSPHITFNVFLFPVLQALYFILVFGVALVLGGLYVYYRDLNQIWEVILQLGFFLSPIVYPVSILPESLIPYYMLNPITVMIQSYRDILLNGVTPPLWELAYLLGTSFVMLGVGTFIFKRLERRFAEEI